MDAFLLLIRLFLAGLFMVAGVAKLFDLKGSETAVRDFGVPEDFVKPFSIVLPVGEILIALLLLPITTAWLGSLAALLLLVVFTIGMGYQMAKGNAPDCHCFGQLHSERVSNKSLIRNSIFAFFALILAAQGPGHQGFSLIDDRLNNAQTVFGLVVIAGLAGIIFFLKRISDAQAAILRRIEILDVISREGSFVERNEAGDPADSLPIGAPFPDFELPDVHGKIVSFQHLLGGAKPILFLFVAPTCQPCKALMPEVEQWQTELEDKVTFIFISRGSVEDNADKFSGETTKRFLLQKDREVQNLVHAKWTPSAIFVNGEGRIASHVATGDAAIRALVEKITLENIADPFVYFATLKEHDRPPKIGEAIPDFSLSDLEGKPVVSDQLRGRQTLVTFWSLTCPHCRDMMEDIKEWEKTRGVDDPSLVLFSDGDAEKHREFGISSPIVIDKEYGTAVKFGMSGTPSGVLVDENGKIVSETAIGAANIWALIGKRR